MAVCAEPWPALLEHKEIEREAVAVQARCFPVARELSAFGALRKVVSPPARAGATHCSMKRARGRQCAPNPLPGAAIASCLCAGVKSAWRCWRM